MGQKRKRRTDESTNADPLPKKHHNTTAKAEKAPRSEPITSTPFEENPRGAELKREVHLYDLLGSEDEAERLQAANAIVSGLVGGDNLSEGTLYRHLDRRLFRGLASGRKGARLGYSVVLTELLSQLLGESSTLKDRLPNLNFEKVLEMLIAKTKPEGDLSGQEEKDHYLGLLFGIQCFVRAKVLFSDSGKRWGMALDTLLRLCKKKPWIREECGWVMVEALPQMIQAQAEMTLEKLNEAGLAASPDGVGVWLTARRLFPDMKFPSKPWGNSGNPLDHLKLLSKALKESSSLEDNENGHKAVQTGSWNPQLHFVWDIVMEEFLKPQSANEKYNKNFENFWKTSVDENLFSASASRERKFWGFLLFQKMLNKVAPYPDLLRQIFSPNLLRCLTNHVSDEDRFLHRAADKSIKSIHALTEAQPNTILVILAAITGENGHYNFDQVTKTKTVEKMLALVDGEVAEAAIKLLLSPILKIVKTDSDRDAEASRQCFADYVLFMIRQVNFAEKSKNLSWIEAVALPVLAQLAYCNNWACHPELSEKSRAMFRSRLTSAFTHLLSSPDGFSYPCELLIEFQPEAVEMDPEILKSKDSAVSVLEKLRKKAKNAKDVEKQPLQALKLLYALVIFQLYNGESDAAAVLEELKICYDKLVRGKDSNYETEASQILVEILLSFVSKPSILLRKVAQHVLAAFSNTITADGLKLMTDVLESSEGLKGQQDLFDQEDQEDGNSEEDEVLDSDVEIVDANGAEGQDATSEEETSEDDDEKDAKEADDDVEAQKLDEALAKALGTHRADEDLVAESSDSDADMTDSEMMALDSKLVEIFSQRKKQPNKKKEKKDARETIVNFKSRVLDLLEVYVKKQTSNPLAFDLLIPLLQLMRTTSAKQVGEKAHNVISSFSKAFKGAKFEDGNLQVEVSERLELLKEIHNEAARDPSHAYAKAASTASQLVATSVFRAGKGSLKKVTGVYRDTQVRWLEGDVKMQASFFHDWVNWCQSHIQS